METQITAEDISNYILTLTDADSGDTISHLKLQNTAVQNKFSE
jgi:hypothetical protein